MAENIIKKGVSILKGNFDGWGGEDGAVEKEIKITEDCALGRNKYLHPEEWSFFRKLTPEIRQKIYDKFREEKA